MRRRITLLIVAALLTVTFPAAKPGESKPGSAKSTPRTSEEKTEDEQNEDRPRLSQPTDRPADKPSASRPAADKKPAEKPSADKPAASRTAADKPQSDERSKPAVRPAAPAPEPDDKGEKEAATFDPSGSLIRASRQVRPEPPRVVPNEPGSASRGGRRGGWNPPPEPPGYRRRHGNRPRWSPPSYAHHHYRGRWRRSYYDYYGSWSFLIWSGPVIYCPPPRARRYPTVIRLPSRTGVYVRQTGDDAIGRAFAAALREELRSQGQRVVYDADRAGIELYVISMEQDPEDPGWASSVSVSYISHPGDRFITTQLLDCGDEQVNDLAYYVAGYADDLAKDYCY